MLRGIYSPFEKLAVMWPLVNTGHVRYLPYNPNDYYVSEARGVGTPDDCWNSWRTNLRKLRKLLWLGKYQTHPVLPDRQHQVSSFDSQTLKNSHGLAWALMNSYLSTWCIPLDSTTYLLTQDQWKQSSKRLSWISLNQNAIAFNSSSSEGVNMSTLILTLSIAILSNLTWFHSNKYEFTPIASSHFQYFI
jgi:hypothetical protein